MPAPLHRRHAITALLAACSAPWAWAQETGYPNKPITLIVPFPAGSGTDQLARMMALQLGKMAKVAVVVDNKAGASGFLASQHVAKAAPDGYTVLITSNTTHAANEHLFKKIPYDPVRDFAPVTAMSQGTMMLLVRPDSPITSVDELLAQTRKTPGKLNFGSGSSSSRVAGELLSQMAKIKVVNVPYKSNPLGLTDLMGGQIDYMFADIPASVALVQSGKLRALAVSGTKRLAAVPNVPTVDEAGIKGYDMSHWSAVYLPAGTPEPIVQRMNEWFHAIARTPEFKTFNAATSSDIYTTTPQELAQFQARESAKWARVIRDAGIQPE